VRRRCGRCHLKNDPAAGISYSAAGLIKYSRVRMPPHDYPPLADARLGVIERSTSTHCLKADSIPASPCSTTELQIGPAI